MTNLRIFNNLTKSHREIDTLKSRYGSDLRIIPMTDSTFELLFLRGYLEDNTRLKDVEIVILSDDGILQHLQKVEQNKHIHYWHVSKRDFIRLTEYLLFMQSADQDETVINVSQFNAYNSIFADEVYGINKEDLLNRVFFGHGNEGSKCTYKTWNIAEKPDENLEKKGLNESLKTALLCTHSEITNDTYPIFWKLLRNELISRGYEVIYVLKRNDDYFTSSYYMDSANMGSVDKTRRDIAGYIELAQKAGVYIGVVGAISLITQNLGVKSISLYPAKCKRISYGVHSFCLDQYQSQLNQDNKNIMCIEMPWLRSHNNTDQEIDDFQERIEINKAFSERLMSYIDD